MLNIRATSLEKFTSCAYSYKFADPLVGNEPFLGFGTDFHKIIELSVRWNRDWEWVWIILQSYWIKERDMLWKWSQVILDKLEELEYEPVIEEKDMRFTYNKEVFLSGTFDFLFKDKNWDYVICDWKTSASKYAQWMIDELGQWKIYAALLKKTYWISIKRFEYFVIVKTSNPKLQIVSFDIPEDCYEEELEGMLDSFIEATENNIWEPRKNYKCFFCKLKNKCRNYVAF